MQEVGEKKRKKGKIIIIINKKLTGRKKHVIMWGLVMLVHEWGSS